MYLIGLKKKIITHIENNEPLRIEFLNTLNIQPDTLKGELSMDFFMIFKEISETDSSNDFLTPKNFMGNSLFIM